MEKIFVDATEARGAIKPMNAVNNGPAPESVRGMSNYGAYVAAGIPFARLHDSAFSTYYGGEFSVDVHRIFRDFDADETDPASYDFEATDRYLETLSASGTGIYYRLGAAIEHGKKRGTYPPADYGKWARVCAHIIRHYNEGWANGYRMNILYWEIWNEPDCGNPDGSNPCWQGTIEEFGRFFAVAFRSLKTAFPHLKIGGPAFASVWNDGKNRAVLSPLAEAGLKPDFLSYHFYGKTVEEFAATVRRANEEFARYGFGDAETHLNEWNYVKGWLGEDWRYTLRAEKGLKGAAFLASVMCAGQALPVDMLMYYDARPCGMNGLFDTDTLRPLKGYYALEMFGRLRRLGVCVSEGYRSGDVYYAAATDGERSALLLSRFSDADEAPREEVRAEWKRRGNRPLRATYYLLDGAHDRVPVREEIFTSERFALYLGCELFSTWLVEFAPLEEGEGGKES